MTVGRTGLGEAPSDEVGGRPTETAGETSASRAHTGSHARGRTDEAARVRALARYAVLDTPADPAFDDAAELARTVTGAGAAGIGFLDGDRVWFKSRLGIRDTQCPRGQFPGGGRDAHVHIEREPMWIGEQEFRFLAAAPLVTSEGYLLGELFVLDEQDREIGDRETQALAALARQVVAGLELRRTLMSYHTVVDGAGHVVFQLDDRARLVSLTPTWTQLTGYGVVRSVGQPLERFVHADDREDVVRQLQDMYGGQTPPSFEFRLGRLTGGDVPVEVIARPLVDEGGRRLGLVGVIADITERKARAIEVQHAQKLEALGRLSAGLAHEINTPMQFVGDNTRFLADSYDALLKLILFYRDTIDGTPGGVPDLRELVREAEQEADFDFLTQEIPPAVQQSLEGVERVAMLVRAMKTFSMVSHDAQNPADLNQALDAVVTVAHSQVKFVADLATDFAELPLVMCNIGDLNQVFLGMLVNAADSIEEKGERGLITVSTRLEGDDVLVSITDTGMGIPEDIRMRIYEPFFTTKEVGRGTGQGLALARAVILDKHAGGIALTSQVGVGTTFTVSLPIAGRKAATPAA